MVQKPPAEYDAAIRDLALDGSPAIADLALASQAIAIALFDLDGQLRYANPGMQMLLGPEDSTAQPAERLINPDFARLRQLADGATNPLFTGIMTMGDGVRLTGSVKAKVFLTKERLLVFGEHDVAQMDWLNRKLAEANRDNSNLQRQLIKDKKQLNLALDQLRASEEKYRRLFESAVLGIIQSTPDGRIININPAFAAMFGYDSPEEMLTAVKDVAADLYADPQNRPQIIRSILSDHHPVQTESRYRRRDGSIFVGNLHKWAVRDEKGQLLYLEGFVEDIDQRKKMEKRLIQARKMEAVAALAGGVAHEFNNALAGLMGNLELMEMENTAWQGGREYFEGIKRTCFRMSGLAAKLLAYARGGKYRTQKTTLEQALAGAREVIQETLAEEISLDNRIQGRLKVALDPTQFRFIIKSLLSNAAEATAAGGKIRLRARDATLSQTAATDLHEHFPAGPYACLAITDFGHGMDSETLSRVFDPFFSTRFPGRGLGMAAVYGIVKNHGGWIFIESQPEKGTTVTVYFPAVAETTPGSQPNRECSSKGRPEENSGMSSRPNRDEPDR